MLVFSYVIYLARYPLWWSLTSTEQIFAMLILSYSAVLLLASLLLKKDLKEPLSDVFGMRGRRMVLAGVALALLFQELWFLISFAIGSRFEFVSFPSLRGYEDYVAYSLPLAFILYLAFVVFGAFAEEIAYRGYVQPRISSKYGYVTGIFAATLFFALQHIHVFQLSWIEGFFHTQFVHVVLFGIFAGYLFLKSKENVWSVFSFHALPNIFAVSLPITVTIAFPFANQAADIASFAIIILLLRYLF